MDLPPPPVIPSDTPPAIIKQMEQPSPVTQDCVDRVSAYYQVHPLVLSLVAQVEGGSTGTVAQNSNATSDLGVMQINSIHLQELKKNGITRAMVENNGCLNLSVAAWYLREVTAGIQVNSAEDWFRAIARYHSKTEQYNKVYANKLMERYKAMIEAYNYGS
ncbi:lytic transglycosylase [Marinobacter halodurans]|uniref:Lytic transglycosylase n=1 Tax=Marinobacter halodurans TaxID=2528979 RepID=A0ABY1ZMA8_9GAMM|nr:lytic transglycosylase domain-containing protein [Marinobacter halodurans]TBW57438.1 lytic transglycosylase [Marinobacter halodurans]